MHPVLFEVLKDGNAVTFATNLIKNLKRVDHHARLIPKPDASADAVPLMDVSDIPNDESAKDFVCDYFDDLHVTSKLLKGKFWVQCKAKFPTFKKNKTFFKWLAGSKNEPKITLVRTELQGPKHFLTGFFFNVVARYDHSGHFTEQMTHLFRDNTLTGQRAPGQEVEPFIMFRNGTTTKVYAMYSSTQEDADLLNNKAAQVLPSPGPDKLSYIPIKVWSVLDSNKKNAYVEMQRSFSASHSAIRFNGINDGNLVLANTDLGVMMTWG